MDLAEFEREPTVFHRVANLGLGVGEGKARPTNGGFDGPLAVVIAQRPAEWLLNQPHDWPGNEKSHHHTHHESHGRPDQAATELLEVLPKGHGR